MCERARKFVRSLNMRLIVMHIPEKKEKKIRKRIGTILCDVLPPFPSSPIFISHLDSPSPLQPLCPAQSAVLMNIHEGGHQGYRDLNQGWTVN